MLSLWTREGASWRLRDGPLAAEPPALAYRSEALAAAFATWVRPGQTVAADLPNAAMTALVNSR